MLKPAPELLEAAAGHMRDRAATYDKPDGERSMGRAVQAFNAITGQQLTEAEGWLLLQVLKDVRAFTSRDKPHRDSIEDCIAYAALKGEAVLAVVDEPAESEPIVVVDAGDKPGQMCRRCAHSANWPFGSPCNTCILADNKMPFFKFESAQKATDGSSMKRTCATCRHYNQFSGECAECHAVSLHPNWEPIK